ncbi:testis-specific serine/threonine-protein kinase 6-like [Astyanax mexicanus]|uniref:testis-specific serine/threonine-protein kinase 6-like n=1 Tax=Astyanax mexicanus TaxID=7994 RepID=UPI0020CABA9F|nr:testis-specific serine/threonine-protein kinase 6-like [Astyanax mexicanus]
MESSNETVSSEEIHITEVLRSMGFTSMLNIGGGNFSTVKLAKTSRYPGVSTVAIKIIECQLLASSVLSIFFSRELSIMKIVKHPHIVHVYEVFELPGGAVCIVMEAASANLAQVIDNSNGIPIRIVKKRFSQIVSAVEYLHNNDIVHRDLKCDNVLLSADGNVKLADFGFSRFMTGELSDTFCGSLWYAAPELLISNCYDPKKSDVWSLGIILYYMATGDLPFKCHDNIELSIQHREPVTFPKHCNVEEECRIFISYMLQYDPQNRPSVSEVAQHPWLQSFQKDVQAQSSSSSVSNEKDMSTSENASAPCPNVEPVLEAGASKEVVEEVEIGCSDESPHTAGKRARDASNKWLASTLKFFKSLLRRIKKLFRRNNYNMHDSTSATTQQQCASDCVFFLQASATSDSEHNSKHGQRSKRQIIRKFLQHIIKRKQKVKPI